MGMVCNTTCNATLSIHFNVFVNTLRALIAHSQRSYVIRQLSATIRNENARREQIPISLCAQTTAGDGRS